MMATLLTQVEIRKVLFNQKIENCKARFQYFLGHYHGTYCTMQIRNQKNHNLILTMIHVGVNDLLNSHSDIDQINSMRFLQNIEHIINKCRQYCVKNMFLYIFLLHVPLLEDLIKDFNISIRNMCSGIPSFIFLDNANITMNEAFKDDLDLRGKGKYVLINNYLNQVCKQFLEVVQHPRMNKRSGTLRFCRNIYKW